MKTSMEMHFGRASRSSLTNGIVMLTVLLGASPRLGFAEQRFTSPEQAANALFVAARDGDEKALARILGAGKEILSARAAEQDTAPRPRFVAEYQRMHRLVPEPDQTILLYVGTEGSPFPVPLVSREGAWSFDAATGIREVLYRQIGENEVTALAVCQVLVTAKRHDARIANHDGEPILYHGYYFRIFSSPSDGTGHPDDHGDSSSSPIRSDTGRRA